MKRSLFTVSVLLVGLTLALTWAVAAQEPKTALDNARALTNSTPLTLKLNLGPGDPIIDPAIGHSAIVNQLFLGLVRTDEETGDTLPELAEPWDVSSDSTVYTFTLRNDVTWTDGNPVTANDVRNGILRSLEPATGSGGAYVLFVIENAQEFNDGSIIDPDQVGITVLNATRIRFDLNQAAAFFPSILANAVAYPVPAWVIAAHPDDWTELAYIETNGPYRLTAWAHDSSMTLEKNADYYDKANVQIDRVLFSMEDEDTAWGIYQSNQLDSVIVPQDQWSAAFTDPLLRQELHSASRACTYYYGFNTDKEPFDDVQVRQAFIAAVDRQRVIDDATGYAHQPALTFTPPSHFGHVDGLAEEVGIPYEPAEARQWLAEAGYPGGEGLPKITLMYPTSTGHQAIAESVRQDWIDNLGVTVALSDTNWSDYLDILDTDPPQVWRLGWCSDYYDAYNYLHDAMGQRVRYGDWSNDTYDSLLSEAAGTADPNTRKSLYKEAEEILVETDAVMLPIYYYGIGVATRPYLERPYGNSGFGGRIADWRMTKKKTVIGTGGGDLTSYDGHTNVQLPSGAITATVVISHTPATGHPPGGNLNSIGNVFDLTAVYSSTDPGIAGLPAQIAPGKFYTVTALYSDTQLGPTAEDTLGLYWWDEDASAYSQQGITSSVNVTDDVVIAQVDHFSLFAVLGETQHRIYLPVVLRNH